MTCCCTTTPPPPLTSSTTCGTWYFFQFWEQMLTLNFPTLSKNLNSCVHTLSKNLNSCVHPLSKNLNSCVHQQPLWQLNPFSHKKPSSTQEEVWPSTSYTTRSNTTTYNTISVTLESYTTLYNSMQVSLSSQSKWVMRNIFSSHVFHSSGLSFNSITLV